MCSRLPALFPRSFISGSEAMRNFHQKIFVVFVISLLILPLGYIFGGKEKTKLAGVDPLTDLPSLQTSTFQKREFQKSFEKWWQSHFLYRKIALKLKNSLYDYANLGIFHSNHSLIQGKKNYLFQKEEIEAIYRKDCSLNLSNISKDLSKINTYLKKKNIPVLFVLGSNKARTYKKFIPDMYKYFSLNECSSFTDWENMLKEIGFPYINTQNIIDELEKNGKYPPYSKTGTHWSTYASVIVDQSILDFFHLPKITVETVIATKEEIYGDRDISNLLNLIKKPLKNEVFYNAIVKNNATHKRIYIFGDSYASTVWHFLVRSGTIPHDIKFLISNRIPDTDEIKNIFESAEFIIFAGRETNLITDAFSPQTQIKAISNFISQN